MAKEKVNYQEVYDLYSYAVRPRFMYDKFMNRVKSSRLRKYLQQSNRKVGGETT